MVKDLKRHNWLYVLTTFWANTVQEDCTGQAGVYSQDSDISSFLFGHRQLLQGLLTTYIRVIDDIQILLIDTDTADEGLISFSVPVYMCNDVQ